ncbi:hypothetical protein [Nostoc sp.]
MLSRFGRWWIVFLFVLIIHLVKNIVRSSHVDFLEETSDRIPPIF